ncbi:hypothetical protein FACS1894187_11790 [Synergistales bacterium]|nr:hypothetical protein FACS1894187_11790 [Synergistales bacterium]
MQLQIWADTNWTLIISIVAGSALLAYLGDILGSKYGKQRISIFGLRPKQTGSLITALTGIFISVTVLVVLSFFSQNVRTALFSMKALQTELQSLYVQLQKSRAESEETQSELVLSRLELASSLENLSKQQILLQNAALSLDMARIDLETLQNDRDVLNSEKNRLEDAVVSLRGESEELRRELDVMRMESIGVQANALLAQKIIPPGSESEDIRKILTSLADDTRTFVVNRLEERQLYTPSDVTFTFDEREAADIVELVAGSSMRYYVRALAAENVAVGESIKVRLEAGRSYLLYNEGDIIYRKLVEPEAPGFSAEGSLHVFLRDLKNTAIKNGVKPDPATNSVGSLEGEEFFEVVEKLHGIHAPVIINAIALDDIYTEGPVKTKIELE